MRASHSDGKALVVVLQYDWEFTPKMVKFQDVTANKPEYVFGS